MASYLFHGLKEITKTTLKYFSIGVSHSKPAKVLSGLSTSNYIMVGHGGA